VCGNSSNSLEEGRENGFIRVQKEKLPELIQRDPNLGVILTQIYGRVYSKLSLLHNFGGRSVFINKLHFSLQRLYRNTTLSRASFSIV
jgi:hypothetical protein